MKELPPLPTGKPAEVVGFSWDKGGPLRIREKVQVYLIGVGVGPDLAEMVNERLVYDHEEIRGFFR